MKNNQSKEGTRYAAAGVDEPREQEALQAMLPFLRETYGFRTGIGAPQLESGNFANYLGISESLGIAVTTDGVGTKILLATETDHYYGIAIDCIANNVNDLLCIGAEPIALVDYIGIDTPDEAILLAVAKGLREGARQSKISIPGGEIAQVGQMLKSHESNSVAFDIVGTAVGLLSPSDPESPLPCPTPTHLIKPGDLIIGLPSSGLHSNGYSLARECLFDRGKIDPDQLLPELGNLSLREEMLTPTRIYVHSVLPLIRKGLVKGVANISGGGLLSVARLNENCTYNITNLPDAPPIFNLIQQTGNLPLIDLYAALNMGIGMVLICAESAANEVSKILEQKEEDYSILGKVSNSGEPGTVHLDQVNLVGKGERFERK